MKGLCRSSETYAVEKWEKAFQQREQHVQKHGGMKGLVGPGKAERLLYFCCVLRPVALDDGEAARLPSGPLSLELHGAGEEGSATTPPRVSDAQSPWEATVSSPPPWAPSQLDEIGSYDTDVLSFLLES